MMSAISPRTCHLYIDLYCTMQGSFQCHFNSQYTSPLTEMPFSLVLGQLIWLQHTVRLINHKMLSLIGPACRRIKQATRLGLRVEKNTPVSPPRQIWESSLFLCVKLYSYRKNKLHCVPRNEGHVCSCRSKVSHLSQMRIWTAWIFVER